MWSSVLRRRVVRNYLASPGTDCADVVAAMCGAHAQVMSAAETSVALRMGGGTLAAVREALWTDRTLVKTWGPRGTVHLLPTRDLGLWTAALAALPHTNPFAADVRMSPAQSSDVVAALDDAVRTAGECLTVDELSDEVVKRTGSWAGDLVMPAFQTYWPRWRQIVGSPLTQGVLCFGPLRGRKVTYTSPSLWSPGFTAWEPTAALHEVIRRYLWSYGPATPAEVARWLSTPVPVVTKAFAAMGQMLEPFTAASDDAAAYGAANVNAASAAAGAAPARDAASVISADAAPVDAAAVAGAAAAAEVAGAAAGVAGAGAAGRQAWLLTNDDSFSEGDATLRLLPYFDAYTVASHPRREVFPGRAFERALARGQAGNYPVLLIDGRAAGVWHQRRSGRRVHVTVEPLSPLSRARLSALDDEVERLGHALAATPTLTIGEVTVGAHA
ncbi:AlkZ family DNA glycosylase [Actinoplanes sp. LDG1-06]|uniref:AlkZ family DNA glycosylase n=1 Tax=Paractinoplanes ovalisporus TaxID=2810368 RepID=A0ABS2AEU7_9ACTN|nr:winged helix DNA-binding domain-containing protein [Actinoplanes ovalisporus]MBM2618347.1 AlkZ family DNA glycosylase [Actinoplanes ovalisporus]